MKWFDNLPTIYYKLSPDLGKEIDLGRVNTAYQIEASLTLIQINAD